MDNRNLGQTDIKCKIMCRIEFDTGPGAEKRAVESDST